MTADSANVKVASKDSLGVGGTVIEEKDIGDRMANGSKSKI